MQLHMQEDRLARNNENKQPAQAEVQVPNPTRKMSSPQEFHVEQRIVVGPLPAPEILQQYKENTPEVYNAILADFQKNSECSRKMREIGQNADIDRDRRGQWMAFCILAGILAVILFSLYLGNVNFAGVSGLAFLAWGTATLYDRRRSGRKEDRKKK